MFNALLIADIRINRIKDAQLAAFLGWHEQSGHGHERQKADRLERDGFAPRVRARNDDGRIAVAQFYIDRNDAVR
ncbi:Uncharacterised protein [Mycobacterium tuberculosis]|nr:Uncharacterised protein [Mycobacterium tuberculosis]